MKAMRDHVIRDMTTGLYLHSIAPNNSIRWKDKKARRFKRLSDVSSFLRTNFGASVPTTWEIIEFELVEVGRFSAATLAK